MTYVDVGGRGRVEGTVMAALREDRNPMEDLVNRDSSDARDLMEETALGVAREKIPRTNVSIGEI